MPTSAKAAILKTANEPLVIENIELDDPKPNEVLVRMISAGVCHTDFSMQNILPKPIILGHEGAGVVELTGHKVTKVSKGDRVVLTFGSCGECPCCINNNPAYCDNMKDIQFSGKRIDGSSTILSSNYINLHASFFQQSSFATYCIATERNVVSIKNSKAPLEILGPLGCGIQTGAGAIFNSLKVQKGSDLVIFGTGSVGLSAIMAANLIQCGRLIAVDTNADRLEISKKLGATHIINPDKENVLESIRNITNDRGANFSLETSGVEKSFNQAIECLSNLGVCGIVTTPSNGEKIQFSPTSILLGGKKLIGILEGSSVPDIFIPKLVKLFLEGRFPIDSLISFYNFSDINKAIEDSKKGKVIKPVLLMNNKI
ncbi:NAD(P)-dependent alcohol dehydrogenase [Alphaproteobacteria bacterium]|nr:NAD(P)-dependent alcohol dehydrogenase [Alphaproteobacteria bacterium]